MNCDLEIFMSLQKDEYKTWLNDSLTDIYIKHQHDNLLQPINHLIHDGDISLALFSFYKTLSTEQQLVFQKAVSEVIYGFTASEDASPAYIVLFDLVKLGKMYLCLNNIAAKIGQVILTDHSEGGCFDDLPDEDDNIFYLGLIAITSMAGTDLNHQTKIEDALYTLIKSPNFKSSYKDYTAKILYALCINNNTNCIQYFNDLYETLEQQFYINEATYDDDLRDLSYFLQQVEVVIGVEQMRKVNQHINERSQQPNPTEPSPPHFPNPVSTEPELEALLKNTGYPTDLNLGISA